MDGNMIIVEWVDVMIGLGSELDGLDVELVGDQVGVGLEPLRVLAVDQDDLGQRSPGLRGAWCFATFPPANSFIESYTSITLYDS